MTDKVQKIREVVENLYSKALDWSKTFNADYWEGRAAAYRNVLEILSTMQEEPQVKESVKTQHENETCKENANSLTRESVSEDLEEAARKIATRHSHISGDTYYANDAWFFKKGAQWQKEKLMNLIRQYEDKGHRCYCDSVEDSEDGDRSDEFYWQGFYDLAKCIIRELN